MYDYDFEAKHAQSQDREELKQNWKRLLAQKKHSCSTHQICTKKEWEKNRITLSVLLGPDHALAVGGDDEDVGDVGVIAVVEVVRDLRTC